MRILNQQFPLPLLRDTAYAAVEPCRRQRPQRSEDAAREQAAEGRMAKRFRPGKKTDETASDMTRDLNC